MPDSTPIIPSGETTNDTPPADDAQNQTPPADDASTQQQQTPPAADTDQDDVGSIVLSQDEYNRRLANQKRRVLKEAEEKLAAANQLQKRVQEVLNGRDIDEVKDEMSELNEALKSEQQKRAEEAEKASNRVANIELERDEAIQKYQSNLVDRKLFEAIGLKARSESAAKLVKRELASRAVVENDEVFVKAMVTEDGVTSEKKVTPDAAVALLEKDVAEWGYAFKSTVNGGAGAEVVDGVQTKIDGQLDWDHLTENPEKFMELQAKDPGFFDRYFQQK